MDADGQEEDCWRAALPTTADVLAPADFDSLAYYHPDQPGSLSSFETSSFSSLGSMSLDSAGSSYSSIGSSSIAASKRRDKGYLRATASSKFAKGLRCIVHQELALAR